jgi:hypothetical protein
MTPDAKRSPLRQGERAAERKASPPVYSVVLADRGAA